MAVSSFLLQSEYLKMAEEGRLKAEEEEEVEGGRLVTTEEGEEGERGAVKGKEEVERVVKREEEAGRESVASESEGVRGEGDGAGNVLRPNGVVKPPLASPPTSPAHQPHPSPKRTNGTASITAPSRPPRRGRSPSCPAYQSSGGDAGKAEKPQVLDIEHGSPRKVRRLGRNCLRAIINTGASLSEPHTAVNMSICIHMYMPACV